MLRGDDTATAPELGREQLDRLELLEVLAVAAPADEVALRVVVELLQAGLQALDLALAQVELLLVPVGQAGDDDFLALERCACRGSASFSASP